MSQLGTKSSTVDMTASSAGPVPGDHMSSATMGAPEGTRTFIIPAFRFECGRTLRNVPVTYTAYGTLASDGNNAVLVGHSLTSNSHIHQWWRAMLGEGPKYCLDQSSLFVVCCNYIGSPYGSCSPITAGSTSGEPYSGDFPFPVTMRDQAAAMHHVLRVGLGVQQLKYVVGGSMGAMLALEFAATYPDFVSSAADGGVVAIAGCAAHTAWAIGWGEAGRQAIFTDPKWRGGSYPLEDPPVRGLSSARMLAMLSYRTPPSFTSKFGRAGMGKRRPERIRTKGGPWLGDGAGRGEPPKSPDRAWEVEAGTGAGAGGAVDSIAPRAASPAGPEPAPTLVGVPSSAASSSDWIAVQPYSSIESYLHYQGDKFTSRFDPACYVSLTYCIDQHDIGRGRAGGAEGVLSRLPHRLLVVGVDSDLLYPLSLQESIARASPRGSLSVVHSPHGHDGFLIEIEALNRTVARWMAGETEGEGQDTIGGVAASAGSTCSGTGAGGGDGAPALGAARGGASGSSSSSADGSGPGHGTAAKL